MVEKIEDAVKEFEDVKVQAHSLLYRVLDGIKDLDRRERKLKKLEAVQMSVILQETNDLGKPEFPNETARQAELIVRMSSSREVIDLKEEIAELKAGLKVDYMEFELYKKEFDFLTALVAKV